MSEIQRWDAEYNDNWTLGGMRKSKHDGDWVLHSDYLKAMERVCWWKRDNPEFPYCSGCGVNNCIYVTKFCEHCGGKVEVV